MGAATPIVGIAISEQDIAPDGNPARSRPSRTATNNDVLTKRLLKRSPSHLALVAAGPAAVTAEPPGALAGVGSGKKTLWLAAIAALGVAGTLIAFLPATPNAVAGLSLRELVGFEAIVVLALSLPAVVPGTLTGLAIYGRMSDSNFKRFTYLFLGISGIALLAKTLGPAIRSLL